MGAKGSGSSFEFVQFPDLEIKVKSLVNLGLAELASNN